MEAQHGQGDDLGNLCDYDEAARLLGIPVNTLYTWVHQKRVPHLRLGPRAVKFNRRELQRWIESKRVEINPGSNLRL
jgi:excisionase family DNA binding protein